MSRTAVLALVAAMGCHSSHGGNDPKVRPVLSTVVAARPLDADAFAGTVEPRYTTQLAFRVGGRVVRRSAAVGDLVKRGSEIAALDRTSLQLSVMSAQANVAAARARHKDASLTEHRQTTLLAQHAVSPAALDNARAVRDIADAAVGEAVAQLDKAREGLSYTVLRAEFDGVVTKINFEVQQYVDPHVVVAELARTDDIDVVVDVPDTVAERLVLGARFTVEPASDGGSLRATGGVRQIGPAADQATRTRRVWIALDSPPPGLRLGTTVRAAMAGAAGTAIWISATSLVEKEGKTFVWVVGGETATVSARAVTVGQRTDAQARIDDGLRAGDRVVLAGVHSLEDGQRVRIDGEVNL